MPEKPKMFVSIVLDESGSMASCRDATISGFNEFMDGQRQKAEGVVLVTLTKFADIHSIVFQANDVHDVKPLGSETYNPHGLTALYDAIGFTIKSLEDDLAREEVTPGVVFVIITDGHNNASKEFTADHIKKMIADREKAGNWTFVFLGADIDAVTANEIGCANVASYNKAATGKIFKAISASTANYANTKLYAGRSLKSDDFIGEAAKEWDDALTDAPRGINMGDSAKNADQS